MKRKVFAIFDIYRYETWGVFWEKDRNWAIKTATKKQIICRVLKKKKRKADLGQICVFYECMVMLSILRFEFESQWEDRP